MLSRLPRSFSGRAGSTSVRSDSPDTVETESAPDEHPPWGCGYVAIDRIVNGAGPNQCDVVVPQSAGQR
jgi:hypothetical protein